jgi:hypothetical protein
MRCLSVVVPFLLVVAGPALADDLYPPPWRGEPGSTWALWEFMDPSPNPPPDMGFNPYGDPTTQIYPGVGQEWWAELNGRVGVWPLSGEAWFDIPNAPEPNPSKEIYIQLTWEPQAPGNLPLVMTTLPSETPAVLVQETPLGGEWLHSVYSITLEPNPTWERILISGGIDVDQVVIDTICIPEPAGCVLLAVCGLLARRRR